MKAKEWEPYSVLNAPNLYTHKYPTLYTDEMDWILHQNENMYKIVNE